MARRVKLDVDVNLTAANAKLRAFEVRAERVTAFGITGRPTGSPFLPFAPGPRRPGADIIARERAISRIQFTTSRPSDQTARGLGVLGSMDIMSGLRFRSLEKTLGNWDARAFSIGRQIGKSAVDEIVEAAKTLPAAPTPTRKKLMPSMTLRHALNPALSFKPFVPPPKPPPAVLSGPGRALVATGSIAPGVNSGVLRSGLEVGGLGRFSSRTTPAGFAIAAIAVLSSTGAQRSQLLKEAAESGDPSTFSYGSVQLAVAQNISDIAVDILDAARHLSLSAELGAAEIVTNAILLGISAVDGFFGGGSDEAIDRRALLIATNADRMLQLTSGKFRENFKAFERASNLWDRGLDNAIERSSVLQAKIARSRSDQALYIGFDLGTGQDLEDRISQDIAQLVLINTTNNFVNSRPHPTYKALSGLKN